MPRLLVYPYEKRVWIVGYRVLESGGELERV